MTAPIDSDKHSLLDFLKAEDPDLFTKTNRFSAFLEDWKGKRTYSYHRLVVDHCGSETLIRDRGTGQDHRMVVLSSNNYLGLNNRPELIQASIKALAKYGSGMCGSRFLSGTFDLLEELEQELAAFEARSDVMVFTSGYQANVGTLSALLRPGDAAYIDRLCHASIVDGCRMSGCEMRPFRHNDVDHLARLLRRHEEKDRGRLIVVDGVFSMDGDMAPVQQIAALARQHRASVMVDEAHATGVVGPTGRGTVEHFGVHDDVDIVIGTFSKALAGTGGFLAADRHVVDYVRHYGRSYMFSASPTPATVAGVLEALRILRTEPGLRQALWDSIHFAHRWLKNAGFEVYPAEPQSAILSVLIGADVTVRKMSRDLYDKGLFMSAVTYPAVSPGQGRLRLSLSAAHTHEQLDRAFTILADVSRNYGII